MRAVAQLEVDCQEQQQLLQLLFGACRDHRDRAAQTAALARDLNQQAAGVVNAPMTVLESSNSCCRFLSSASSWHMPGMHPGAPEHA